MTAIGFMLQKVLQRRTFFFFSPVLVLMLSTGMIGHAQPHLAPVSGEALHYEVTYEWGPIYLEVGEVIFSASSKSDIRPNANTASKATAQQAWEFVGWGTSNQNWDWFYPVNSTYSSTTNAAFQPAAFSRIGREGRHRYNRTYTRNSADCMTLECLDEEVPDSFICREDSADDFRDVLSAIHWCRQLPWSTYERGDVIAMNLMLDGEVHPTTLEFWGNANHHSALWPDSVLCWEFHPTLIDGTVFKPGDEMKVLMTADDRRLPVYIETELIVGAAKIHLAEHQTYGEVAFQMMRDSCRSVTRNLD
jgi:hypothetical protein